MASSSEEHANLSQLLQLDSDARTTNYMEVAALSVLLFDYLLTLDREIQLIWKRPKQMAANSFLLNRYFSILAISAHVSFMLREVKTNKECSALFYLEAASTIVIIPTVDLVLLLRVWALYGKAKILLYCFLPVIFVEPFILWVDQTVESVSGKEFNCTTRLGLDIKVVRSVEKGYVHAGQMIKGCYPLTNPERASYTAMVYAPLVVVLIFIYLLKQKGLLFIGIKSTAMFLLTMYKCGTRLYKNWKRSMRIRTPILSLFMRDGIYWFAAVLGLFISQIIMASIGRVSLGTVMINPCLVGYAVISSRMLLNMKEISLLSDIKEFEVNEGPVIILKQHPINNFTI